jgi:hypothetical protein
MAKRRGDYTKATEGETLPISLVLGRSVEDGNTDCELADSRHREQSIFRSAMLVRFKDFNSYKADAKSKRPKEDLYGVHGAQYWGWRPLRRVGFRSTEGRRRKGLFDAESIKLP